MLFKQRWGAGVLDDLRHTGNVSGILGVADETTQRLGSGWVLRVGVLERQGKEDGALAFAQIVASRLSSDRGVAEDAELVIAQLEGDSDVAAVATESVDKRRLGACDCGTKVKRSLDGVRGRLVTVDRVG